MSRVSSGIAAAWVCFLAAGLAVMAGAQPANDKPPVPAPYAWHNVVIRGGGFVTGIIYHPHQKDLIYARTDVGGAYRWDAAAEAWVPITDWVGAGDVNLTGIESLAVDPSDSNRLYLAAGTYSRGNAAILRSDDQGRTFKRTDVPFKMGGNESGRFNGERLAVDPNQGDILFFGSRRDGLWKSADRGETWQPVKGFPAVGSGQQPEAASGAASGRPRFGFGQQPVGIVCVLFDPSGGRPGGVTAVLYAAVSTTETNLYRSSDAGASWQPVPGQPVGFRPNHLVRASNGLLYLTYGKEPGPNTMSDGAVWKYDPRAATWTDITPVKPATSGQSFGYGAVAVDPQHPSTVMVTTFAHWRPHDQIFRSTNAGASWVPLWSDNTQWDSSGAPYTRSRTPHWMGSLVINPFNPDQVLFTTGFGIWGCVNVTEADTGRATRWKFMDAGLEETVPLALISPPAGAHLLSGLGDIDGFRHDDLTVSPQATFAGPAYGNTEDLAFAADKPDVIVRTGTSRGRRGNPSRGAYSLDGGGTWQAFATEPAPGGGAGSITLSADGGSIVWTPRSSAPHYSVDRGTKWIPCPGLSSGLRVVADSVNPARFYAYDPRAGKFFASANIAAGFTQTGATFASAEGFGGGFGGGGGEGAMLSATPGREGDLWLSFRTKGLLHSTNGGMNFAQVAGVQAAQSLGFGKPAPGKSYPTLFLAGSVHGVTALFRSVDAGETWVRINDDSHQFGWINHVTGDPRVYGRVYFATGGRGIIYGDPE
jgi:hypothetical protein